VTIELPAFIGVSLDSDLFSREWIRGAIRQVLTRHSKLLFVLGDGLLAFNKSSRSTGLDEIVLDLAGAEQRITKRAGDVQHLLAGEVRRLDASEQNRIFIRTWADYSDAQFVPIARALDIAYATIAPFRECVDRDVEIHLSRQIQEHYPADIHRRLCALYVLEETAMIIRITEAGYPHEYYPQQHIQTLTAIYAGKFNEHGLSIEKLVHHPRERVFRPLAVETDTAASWP
jgi:hypothetical protein